MTVVAFSNLSQVIVDGLTTEATERGLVIQPVDEVDLHTPFVHTVGMMGSSGEWDLVGSDRWANQIGCVVVTDRYQSQFYRRAYELAAAVAHVDMPTSAIIDVVSARARGEVLAPAELLRSVVSDQETLLSSEVAVLNGIAKGMTVSAIAEETYYSERHVRRLLQSILTKAATSDRKVAVEHFGSYLY